MFRMKRLAAFIAILFTVAPAARAATFTWSGADGAAWNTTDTNWTPTTGATPWDSTNGANSNAVFTNTSGSVNVTNTGVWLNGINDTASSGSFTIQGGPLNFVGSPTISAAGGTTLTLSGGISATQNVTFVGNGIINVTTTPMNLGNAQIWVGNWNDTYPN